MCRPPRSQALTHLMQLARMPSAGLRHPPFQPFHHKKSEGRQTKRNEFIAVLQRKEMPA